MISYELAKALKEAGFPGLKSIDYLTQAGIASFSGGPTLEELIEACVKLSQTRDFHLERNGLGDDWGASVDCFAENEYISGKTPIEAVARLWLALYGNTGASA
jgi:hypothetical protein